MSCHSSHTQTHFFFFLSNTRTKLNSPLNAPKQSQHRKGERTHEKHMVLRSNHLNLKFCSLGFQIAVMLLLVDRFFLKKKVLSIRKSKFFFLLFLKCLCLNYLITFLFQPQHLVFCFF